MSGLARPALDLLLELLRAAVPLGEAALQAVLELLLTRAASPLVVLEPLRGADFGLPPRERDALLGQLVHRRIADMRETAARLADTGGHGQPPERRCSPAARGRPGGARRQMAGQPPGPAVLARSAARSRPSSARHRDRGAPGDPGPARCPGATGGLSDDGVERLEETARHTRRLGIAGAKLGLAPTPD